jgi:hypothetical protein
MTILSLTLISISTLYTVCCLVVEIRNNKKGNLLGLMKNKVVINGDIVEPTDEKWDADK